MSLQALLDRLWINLYINYLLYNMANFVQKYTSDVHYDNRYFISLMQSIAK